MAIGTTGDADATFDIHDNATILRSKTNAIQILGGYGYSTSTGGNGSGSTPGGHYGGGYIRDNGQFQLSWNGVAGAIAFRVYRGSTTGGVSVFDPVAGS